MAFGTYKSLREVALAHQVSVTVAPFIEPIPLPVDERFQSDLNFALVNIDVRASETSIGEFLIAPVLKEVWKPYSDSLLIWSHIPLSAGDELTGVPDYFSTRRSPLGPAERRGKLAELFPRRCTVLRDGAEIRIYTADLVVGERVLVKVGGRIPADGVVTDGRSGWASGLCAGVPLYFASCLAVSSAYC